MVLRDDIQMEDAKQKAKEYDRLMGIVWTDLGQAINNPKQKSLYTGPGYVEYYRETLKFLSEYDSSGNWDKYDLPLLDKPAKDLSEDEIWDWKVYIAQIRGYLGNIIKDC